MRSRTRVRSAGWTGRSRYSSPQQRTPLLDSAVGVIAMLANPVWLAFVVGLGAISYARRREASLSIAALLFLAGAYVLAYGLQAMFAKHAANQSEMVLVNGFAGFPSAALTASTAGYGMLCYLLAAETAKLAPANAQRRRSALYHRADRLRRNLLGTCAERDCRWIRTGRMLAGDLRDRKSNLQSIARRGSQSWLDDLIRSLQYQSG